VIGPTINIRISAKDPMDYVERYRIGPDKLGQQLIGPDVASMTTDNFKTWLANRAQLLSEASNQFLASLRPSIDMA